MADISFPPTTAPNINPAESGGELINAYAETLSGEAPATYVIRRTSGLRQFSDTGLTPPFRGSFVGAPLLFTAWNGFLAKTDSAGISSTITALAGSDWVTFARNQKTPTPDNVLVCQTGAFTFDGAGKAVWGAPPAAPNSVCWGDGFFYITIGDGRVYASDLNATTINTLSRIQAQARQNDGLVRAVWYAGELWIFSNKHCEVWGSGGSPNPPPAFPHRRTTVIPRGLASISCITGWEDGFGGRLCLLADDLTIRAFDGYTPEVISEPWLTTFIEDVADKNTLTMGCFVKRGHPVIFIRGQYFCFAYDFATKWWHGRQSYLSPTWRFPGGCSNVFNEWLGGDSISGKIGAIDHDIFGEYTDPLVWRVRSGPVIKFPTRMAVARVAFQFQQGTGLLNDGIVDNSDVDPMVEIAFSDDNAASWSNPIQRELGRIGEYRNLVDATQLGMTEYVGRRWELTCGARVYVGLMGGGSMMQERI